MTFSGNLKCQQKYKKCRKKNSAIFYGTPKCRLKLSRQFFYWHLKLSVNDKMPTPTSITYSNVQ